MSWLLCPSRFHALPPESDNQTLWKGLDGTADEGLFRFRAPGGRYVIADSMYTRFRSGATILECNPSMSVNGACWYGGARGGWRIWKTSGGAWILTDSSIPLGSDPIDDIVETGKDDGTTETKHYGDAFYIGEGDAPAIRDDWVFKPAGTLLNDEDTKDATKTFKRELNGWYSREPLGRYAGEGVGGERTFGTPLWMLRKGDSTRFIRRSVTRDAKGDYRYGIIRRDGGSWVIGVKGEEGGYWTGDEPEPEKGGTFRRVKGGDDDEEQDYTLAWIRWDYSTEKGPRILVAGETAFL